MNTRVVDIFPTSPLAILAEQKKPRAVAESETFLQQPVEVLRNVTKVPGIGTHCFCVVLQYDRRNEQFGLSTGDASKLR